MNGILKKWVWMTALLIPVAISAGDDVRIVDPQTHSTWAANQYVKQELKFESPGKTTDSRGNHVFVSVGSADRLFTKDFPGDMESVKIMAFMQNVYLLFFDQCRKTEIPGDESRFLKTHREVLLNGYEFDIRILAKKISQYQTNYIEIRYSLKNGDRILYECREPADGKATVTIDFPEKTLDAVAQLIRSNSTIRFTNPGIFCRETEFGGKRRIRDLAVITIFELPPEK